MTELFALSSNATQLWELICCLHTHTHSALPSQFFSSRGYWSGESLSLVRKECYAILFSAVVTVFNRIPRRQALTDLVNVIFFAV